MASLIFLRIALQQCVKTTAKFGGLARFGGPATISGAYAPSPSVEPGHCSCSAEPNCSAGRREPSANTSRFRATAAITLDVRSGVIRPMTMIKNPHCSTAGLLQTYPEYEPRLRRPHVFPGVRSNASNSAASHPALSYRLFHVVRLL